MKRQRKIFYGWWVVIGLVVVSMVGPMSRFCMTAFFPFISSELGWSRSTIGFAQSLHMWAYALLVLLAGWMTDRIGGRKTILIGSVLSVGGWLLLAIVRTPWQLYLYYGFFIAVAVSLTHAVPTQATSRKWFVKRAGLVIGINAAAFSVGQAIFIPLLTGMSSSIGWRNTSTICAFAFGITLILITLFLIRDTPESMGLSPDGEGFTLSSRRRQPVLSDGLPVKEAARTLPLWLLFIAYSLQGIPFTGITAHLVMWGVDLGSPVATAGVFTTALTLPAVVTRVGGGWLSDKYGKKRVIIIGNILCVLAMLYAWLGVHSTQNLMFFGVVFGLTYGTQIGVYTPYLGDLFGRANIGFLFSLLTMGFGIIGGMGPLLWGKIFEISGSYNLACLVSAVCFAIATIVIIPIRPVAAKVQTELPKLH